MHTESLITCFTMSSYVLERNLEGLSHEDSLRQPVPGGNCLNWVMGHIVQARNRTLKLVGAKPLFEFEKFAAYEWDPVTSAEGALPFDELVENYKMLQEPLLEGIKGLREEDMAAKAQFGPTSDPDETVGSMLPKVAFHEAYHVGQTAMLRRLAGHPGALGRPK